MSGEVLFRKKLTRTQFQRFMAQQEPCVVVMEACGSANHWARDMVKSGHEVKLIAPHYVSPFVKRNKNDAADAEAIVEAAQRPEMRFVQPKTMEQQARGVLFRTRDLLVRQRTQLINSLRSQLYEFGYVAPIGPRQLTVIADIVDNPNTDLPAIIRKTSRNLLDDIEEKDRRIDALLKQIKQDAALAETARRLQTIPGVGPITAMAVEAFAPPMESFQRGRDFAAWLGLVPRQHSSGGKHRLGRVSKAGQADIRRLLITGAMSRLNWMGRKTIREGSWLAQLAARKPRKLVAVALANKMARTIWAMMTRKEDYRDPALAAAA
jgi:transposase